MAIERYAIKVGDLSVEIVRKDIKNLHVGVYPPNGRVRVAAPRLLDDEAVRLAVISRLGWICRQQKRFDQQVRQSQREMVTGESHYFQGQRYILDIVEHDGPASVHIVNNTTMELRIRPGRNRNDREAVLLRWYRRRLREQIPKLLSKWEPKIGVKVDEVRIKRMKTRWGTCTSEDRRIWLNLELVKKPSACLEYILVHEMLHFLERHHNDRYNELLDQIMPQWQLYREELNRAPLAYQEWR